MKNKMLTRNGWYAVEVKEDKDRDDGTIKVVVTDPYHESIGLTCSAIELDKDALNELEQAIAPHCVDSSFTNQPHSLAYKIQEAINMHKLRGNKNHPNNSILVEAQLVRRYSNR